MAENISVSATTVAHNLSPKTNQVAEQPPQTQQTPPPDEVKSTPQVDPAELEQVVEQLNALVSQSQRALNFSVDKASDEVVIKVTDKQTDEVIRQIPTKEALELRKHLEGVLGVLFNDRV